MYKTLIILLILLAGIGVVDATFTNVSQTHGENWIKWTWGFTNDLGKDELLVLYLDGDITNSYDLKTTPDPLVPTYYSLANLNANEEHTLKIVLLDNLSAPATLLDQEINTVTTSLPATYYYLILGIAVLLFVLSLVAFSSRMALIGLFLDVGAVLLLAYLAVSTYQFNRALSTISILLAIMTILPIIYALYKSYENSQNWRE
jgi:hypothetical protein